jgi:hypothetical protein
MIDYAYVKARCDIKDYEGNILCYQGDIYLITYIDREYGLYHVEAEPVGGFPTSITAKRNDPDFDFLFANEIEEECIVEEIAEGYILGEVVEEIVEEFVEEILEDEYYEEEYYEEEY